MGAELQPGDPQRIGPYRLIRRLGSGPDSSLITTADEGGHAYLWNVATRALLAMLSIPGGNAAGGVAFSPDGKTLAIAGGDGSQGAAYLWDVATRQLAATFRPPASEGASSVAFSPDGQTLAVGTYSGATYLWNITTGKGVATLSNSSGAGVTAVAFAPDGKTIVTTYVESLDDAFLWNAATGRVEAKLPDPAGLVEVLGASLSRDGKILAVAANNGAHPYVRIWQ